MTISKQTLFTAIHALHLQRHDFVLDFKGGVDLFEKEVAEIDTAIEELRKALVECNG